MSATKIFWGQIVVALAIVLITMWAATQWVAWKLGYQPQLGLPWFELISGIPVYLPPSFFWWWYAYDAYAPQVFVEGAYIAASGGIISVAAAIGMSVWRAREAKTVATYGSARWATALEIRAAGLAAPDEPLSGRRTEPARCNCSSSRSARACAMGGAPVRKCGGVDVNTEHDVSIGLETLFHFLGHL
jgi:type IV secretion system protein VirD4